MPPIPHQYNSEPSPEHVTRLMRASWLALAMSTSRCLHQNPSIPDPNKPIHHPFLKKKVRNAMPKHHRPSPTNSHSPTLEPSNTTSLSKTLRSRHHSRKKPSLLTPHSKAKNPIHVHQRSSFPAQNLRPKRALNSSSQTTSELHKNAEEMQQPVNQPETPKT